ncbi:MAG: 4-hydroxythreonine-4-phosphate dehydrogenase PdxA, partial [Myxococcota bacterium]
MLPLAIATGDPAGVGPLVSLRALQSLGDVPAILFGDAAWLTREAASSGLELRQIATPADYREGIAAVSSATWADEVVQARAPTVEGGRAQLAALDAAITAVQDGRARALVTAPTSKEAVASTGMPFRGQTEHLARRAGQEQDSVTMMFAGPVLRVGLVTTHLSLLEVPQAITPVRVRRTIRHMSELLSRLDLEGGGERRSDAEGSFAVDSLDNQRHAQAGADGSDVVERCFVR